MKLVKCQCNSDIRKFFFFIEWCPSGICWSLDNDSVTAKTVNGLKTKLEREQAKKMGLFLD